MKKALSIIFATVLVMVFSTGANAVVPELIPVQGVLADDMGEPVDGAIDITFSLYDASDATLTIWTDVFLGVDVLDGFFTVYLGSNTPLNSAAMITASELWLGIAVASDPEMDRIRLAAVPFAIEAEYCGQIGELTEDDIQPVLSGDNVCPAGQFLQGWNSDTQLPICGEDDTGDPVPTYTVGYGIDMLGNEFSADVNEIQTILDEQCESGYFVASIDPATGDVTCAVPPDINTDTLAALTGCAEGEVAKNLSSVWTCAPDEEMTESELAAYLSDNNYVVSSDLADVAFSGLYSDLDGAPVLADVATSGLFSDLSGDLVVTSDTDDVVFQVNHNTGEMYPAPKHIGYSGYCNTHATATGWNYYCLSNTDYNNAADYFTVAADGTVTFLRDGFYRMNFSCISYGANYAHINLMKNGSYYYQGHEFSDGTWTDNTADVTWPFSAGDTFYVRVYNPGNYAYHSGNANGAYGRLQISFEGAI